MDTNRIVRRFLWDPPYHTETARLTQETKQPIRFECIDDPWSEDTNNSCLSLWYLTAISFPQHAYVFYTSHPDRAARWFSQNWASRELRPENVHLSVVCHSQEEVDDFVPQLLKLPVHRRGLTLNLIAYNEDMTPNHFDESEIDFGHWFLTNEQLFGFVTSLNDPPRWSLGYQMSVDAVREAILERAELPAKAKLDFLEVDMHRILDPETEAAMKAFCESVGAEFRRSP